MYLPINIFLNRTSYFETLIVELYEIARKKRELYKNYNDLEELKNLDEDSFDKISKLLNIEYEILNELFQANTSSAHDFGFFKVDNYNQNKK